MEQMKGLWRDTKWAWLGFAILIFILAVTVSWLIVLLLAILPFMFTYFAFVGYDKKGNQV